MRCMYMHGPAAPVDSTIWFLLAMLLLFLLVIKASNRIRSEQKEMNDRALRNQEDAVAVLREIRDSLKK